MVDWEEIERQKKELHKEAMKLAWRVGNDAWKHGETPQSRMFNYREAYKVSKALINADSMVDRAERAERALLTRIDRLAAKFAAAMLSSGRKDFTSVIDDAYRTARDFAKKARGREPEENCKADDIAQWEALAGREGLCVDCGQKLQIGDKKRDRCDDCIGDDNRKE
jgi:hypothetical protein